MADTPLKIEIIGLGVTGYNTAQEMLVLENRMWKYQPDLVILAFFHGNDLVENNRLLGLDDMQPTFDLQNGRLQFNKSFMQSEEYRNKSSMLGQLWLKLLSNSRLMQMTSLFYAPFQSEKMMATIARASVLGAAYEPGIDVRVYSTPTTPEWQSAWAITEVLLERMHREVKNITPSFLSSP